MQKLDKQRYLIIEHKETELTEVEFTNKEVEEIKTLLEGKEQIKEEELERLNLLKEKSGIYSIELGKLFMDCWNHLFESAHLLIAEDSESKKELGSKLNAYLKEFKTENLRVLVESYGGGLLYGSFYEGEKLKDLVNTQRDKLNNLVLLFFRIFGDD